MVAPASPHMAPPVTAWPLVRVLLAIMTPKLWLFTKAIAAPCWVAVLLSKVLFQKTLKKQVSRLAPEPYLPMLFLKVLLLIKLN